MILKLLNGIKVGKSTGIAILLPYTIKLNCLFMEVFNPNLLLNQSKL